MMNPLALTGMFVGITCLLLAVFILKYGTNKVQKSFGFQNFAIGLYGFGMGLAGMSSSPETASIWWKVAVAGGYLIAPLLLNHVLLLNNISRKGLLYALWIWAASYPVICLSGLDGMRLSYVFNSYYLATPTNAFYNSYYAVWVGAVIYVSYLVVKGYLRSSQEEKRGMLLYAVAYLGGIWGGATHFFMVTMNVNILYPYGNLLICAYCIIVTYAIFRHNLFDIEVIIRKTLVFAGLLVFVLSIFILPTLVIQEFLLTGAGFKGRLLGLTIGGLVIIFGMKRVEVFLVNVTDKYLFQKKYDYKALLRTFTTEVLTVLELDDLVNLTVNKLTDIVKLKSCAVLLFDDDKQQFDVMASQGIKDRSVTLIRPDGIVTFMDETHGYLLLSELRENKTAIPDSIQEIIEKLNAELIIPMVMHEEVIGVLSLGKKKSDEDYTEDDLSIILPLARTLAIAISNAKLFIELGKTQAEAAQREKMAVIGTLSAGINHEICNPLGIARGQCEAFLLNLKDGLYKSKTNEELLTKAKEIMAKVIKETDRATSITKKLSGFAKPSKGESESVDIAKEIDEVISLVGYELKLEKIDFEKKIDHGLPNIYVDKKQFQEVLFNLIRNAGQAIGDKGRITISAFKERERVFIDIKDTGSGIPEDKVKQLFNPFFTTKDPGKGTGLGLFIVRQVIEKNGGRIYLKETTVGEGTTFRVEFPAADSAAAKKGS